jgi:hypothetical protein
LEAPQAAPWPEKVQIDAFPDLLASKMVALVDRGAPRDFRDIYALAKAGLATSEECWNYWRIRQKKAKGDTDPARARLAILTHLARIETQRPLEQINDPDERAAAEELRAWFREKFINALLD